MDFALPVACLKFFVFLFLCCVICFCFLFVDFCFWLFVLCYLGLVISCLFFVFVICYLLLVICYLFFVFRYLFLLFSVVLGTYGAPKLYAQYERRDVEATKVLEQDSCLMNYSWFGHGLRMVCAWSDRDLCPAPLPSSREVMLD